MRVDFKAKEYKDRKKRWRLYMKEFFKIKRERSQIMIKYHNDMNLVVFKNFTQRELNLFYSICALMENKNFEETIIPFDEIKKITEDTFRSESELIQYIFSTNEKFMKIRGRIKQGAVTTQFILFPVFKTNEDEKTLTVQINKDFIYILNEFINGQFTMFELQEFNSLKSSYSKNLFKLLKQFRSKGEFYITTQRFREILDIPVKYRMSEIDKFVFTPILKELPNYFSNLSVVKVKKGKTITNLHFYFTPQPIIKKDEIQAALLCPLCGEKLEEIYGKDNICFFGHRDYRYGKCKGTFSSIEKIEEKRKEIEGGKSEVITTKPKNSRERTD